MVKYKPGKLEVIVYSRFFSHSLTCLLCSVLLFLYFKCKNFFENIEFGFFSIEINLISSLLCGLLLFFYNTVNRYLSFAISKFIPESCSRHAVQKICGILLKYDVKWGVCRSSKVRKNLNTAEALFFPAFFGECIPDSSLNEFKICTIDLISNIKIKGLTSNSYGIETVQCTAVGLFVLSTIRNRNVMLFNNKQVKEMSVLYAALMSSMSKKYGWGTITKEITRKDLTRFTTTFWALRAINSYHDGDDLPQEMIETLYSIMSMCPDGRFGFVCDDEAKVTSVCLFLLLVFEIRDDKVLSEIDERLDIKKMLQIPMKFLSTQILFETEEYSTSEFADFDIEKLPFTHMTTYYAISALHCYNDMLSFKEKYLLNRTHNAIVNDFLNDKLQGYGLIRTSSEPFVYEIAYFLEALYHRMKDSNKCTNTYFARETLP